MVPEDQFRQKWDEANQLGLTAERPTRNKADRIIPWEPWPILVRRRFVASLPLWNELVLRGNDWEYAVRLIAADPQKAFVPGVFCIQREHSRGRLYDYSEDPKGVELGLTACREAYMTRSRVATRNPVLEQLIADRFWLIGIEALERGTDEQAIEAFGCSASIGTRTLFRVKGAGAWLAMKLTGRWATRLLLAKYLANKRPASQAAG